MARTFSQVSPAAIQAWTVPVACPSRTSASPMTESTGSLRDRVAREQPVLGVAPGPLPALDPLLADGVLRRAPAVGPAAAREEVARPLVVHDAAAHRVEGRRVPDVVPGDAEVLAEEEAHLPPPGAEVLDGELAHEDVLVEVHGVVDGEEQAETFVEEVHVGHERLAEVAEIALPPRADPGEGAVDPDADARGRAAEVVLLPDVGEVEVAQRVLGVEAGVEGAVADRDVPGHWASPAARLRRRRLDPRGRSRRPSRRSLHREGPWNSETRAGCSWPPDRRTSPPRFRRSRR